MKPNSRNRDEVLFRGLGRHGNPPEQQIESQIDKAWRELQTRSDRVNEAAPESLVTQEWAWRSRRAVFAGALLAVSVVVVVAVVMIQEPGNRDSWAASRGDQQIAFGETVLSSETNSALVLADSSRIEMRKDSTLMFERAADGVRIRLSSGTIIVSAAKQRSGHLYVQTKDLTASVLGTVFMVSAETAGSRVVVLEGEVQVQQGEKSKKLRAGDQVATGASMQVATVAAEIAWSPGAPAHLALLEQNALARPAAAQPLEFAGASIRPVERGESTMGLGFGCRGVDGTRLAPYGEGQVPDFVLPLGRCMGVAGFPQLISFAYGISHRYGPNAPDWAGIGATRVIQVPTRDGTEPFEIRVRDQFRIEAIADNPADVTGEQLRQMVERMLIDRFKLKAHRETQEAPGYVLTAPSGASKLKEVSGDPTQLRISGGSAGRPVLRGRSTLDELIVFLIGFSNPSGYMDGQLPSYIENKTGLTGLYEWELEMPLPGGGNRGGSLNTATAGVIPQSESARQYAWRAPAVAAALESQLGLRMQPQLVPVEVLVVEYVERPSPN